MASVLVIYLKLIPDDLLLDLAAETKVDFQVKKLFGRNVFNLLLIWAAQQCNGLA